MDRRKNMCFYLVPVYYGERGIASRGKPNESNDYYFLCYVSASPEHCGYRRAENIEDLCNGCKKYFHIKPLTKDEIRDKFYNGKPREVMVVSTTGWHFKEV